MIWYVNYNSIKLFKNKTKQSSALFPWIKDTNKKLADLTKQGHLAFNPLPDTVAFSSFTV